jgi:hypothetical protein
MDADTTIRLIVIACIVWRVAAWALWLMLWLFDPPTSRTAGRDKGWGGW